jgi:hypothetical protein
MTAVKITIPINLASMTCKLIQRLKSPIFWNDAILQFLDARHFPRITNILVILNSIAEVFFMGPISKDPWIAIRLPLCWLFANPSTTAEQSKILFILVENILAGLARPSRVKVRVPRVKTCDIERGINNKRSFQNPIVRSSILFLDRKRSIVARTIGLIENIWNYSIAVIDIWYEIPVSSGRNMWPPSADTYSGRPSISSFFKLPRGRPSRRTGTGLGINLVYSVYSNAFWLLYDALLRNWVICLLGETLFQLTRDMFWEKFVGWSIHRVVSHSVYAIYRLELFLCRPCSGHFCDSRHAFFTRPNKYTNLVFEIRACHPSRLFAINAPTAFWTSFGTSHTHKQHIEPRKKNRRNAILKSLSKKKHE